MLHGPAAPLIVLGTRSTMSDLMLRSIKAGEETYGWNASKAGDVRLVCLEKSTYATSVSVFTSVLVERIIPPLSRPVNRWTSCLRFPWTDIGTKTFRMCSSISYRWSVGCWQKIVSIVSYDRAMCYPLSHKSMQCDSLRGVPLALITPLFWWRTTMKEFSLPSQYKRARTSQIVSAGQNGCG